jgi:hypothetical protein
MKKLYLFMVLLLLVSPLLMAAGGQAIKISGNITAINTVDKTITINDTILVKVTDNTYICQGPAPCIEITFYMLAVGDRVKITAQYVGDVLVAKKIVVH